MFDRMKVTIDLRSALLGLVAGLLLMFTLGAAGSNNTPDQMEYRVVYGNVPSGNFQNSLSRAANEGWKLEQSDTLPDRDAYAVLSRVKR